MAAVLRPAEVQTLSGAASEAPWVNCGPGIAVKVLAVDTERKSVEYLAHSDAGVNVGVHRHFAEGYIFIVEGSVLNKTTGCVFKAGDFCYQPTGDQHEEEAGPEGVTAYVSQRGTGDLLVEFLDRDGKVIDKYSISDFAKILAGAHAN
jgi:anti-sigma factor ChrR (cupin superfamily)